eukprot:8410198-Alexandrium_andersonii.AAC.1
MLLRLRRLGFAVPRRPKIGARSFVEGLMALGSTGLRRPSAPSSMPGSLMLLQLKWPAALCLRPGLRP